MGDTEKTRPNANYRLSRENLNPDEITYHYSRERRLENAPQAVRDLYNEQPPQRFSLLRPLINSKPKKMMLFTIVFLCIFTLVLSMLGATSDTRNLDGNRLSFRAMEFEGTVIISIKKTIAKNLLAKFTTPYTGAVDIAVSPIQKDAGDEALPPHDIFLHKIFFTLEPEENYRFAVPFGTEELALVIQTEKSALSIAIKPE